MSKIFGSILKELRTEKGISQQSLANVFCVSKMTISAWENDKQEPCIEDIKKLAHYFETSTDYLLGYNSEDCTRITEELTIKSISDIKLTRRK